VTEDRREGWVSANGATGAVISKWSLMVATILMGSLIATGIGTVGYIYVEVTALDHRVTINEGMIDKSKDQSDRVRHEFDERLKLRDERFLRFGDMIADTAKQVDLLGASIQSLQISVAQLAITLQSHEKVERRPTIGSTPQDSKP